MKIEIGESLILSWLRHVMGCPIAQTNWKPSPMWPIHREAGLTSDFEKMREVAAQRLGFEVFKKSSFQQFIRQAEIDVLGLRSAMLAPRLWPSTPLSMKTAFSTAISRRQSVAF
jgi:hypothetical protein